jgi:hypothetical protein
MAKVFKLQPGDPDANMRSFMTKSAEFKAWKSALTEEETNALDYYKEDGYGPINIHLRGGVMNEKFIQNEERNIYTAADVIKHVDLVESAIRKSKLSKNTTVFRGLSLKDDFPIEDLLHKGFTEPAFMSTSTSARVAGRFASVPNRKQNVVIVMELPKGSPASLSSVRLGYAEECELLLPRNTKIVPTKIEEQPPGDAPPRYIVHAEVVFAKN